MRSGPSDRGASKPRELAGCHLVTDHDADSVVYRIRLVETAGPVAGSLTVLSGPANRDFIEMRFGCRMRSLHEDQEWQCSVPFRRLAPNWGALLGRLDSADVQAPPSNDGLRLAPIVVCEDGTPWELTIRSPSGSMLVQDKQICGPTGPNRKKYEEIEAVIASVVALADSA